MNTSTKTRFLMFQLINFMGGIIHILNSMPATGSKKVPKKVFRWFHGVTSLFLVTPLRKCLGTKDTSRRGSDNGIVSQSCSKYILSCSTIKVFRCRILQFIKCCIFSMTGVDTQASLAPTLVYCHDVLSLHNVPSLWCLNKQRCPWKRWCLTGSICCFKSYRHLSTSMVLSQIYMLPMIPWSLIHPIIIKALINGWRGI